MNWKEVINLQCILQSGIPMWVICDVSPFLLQFKDFFTYSDFRIKTSLKLQWIHMMCEVLAVYMIFVWSTHEMP